MRKLDLCTTKYGFFLIFIFLKKITFTSSCYCHAHLIECIWTAWWWSEKSMSGSSVFPVEFMCLWEHMCTSWGACPLWVRYCTALHQTVVQIGNQAGKGTLNKLYTQEECLDRCAPVRKDEKKMDLHCRC